MFFYIYNLHNFWPVEMLLSPFMSRQGKDMLMILENDTMKLIDPLGQTLLHAQPIGSIRVWGVGRDNGRSVSTLQRQNEDENT